jgi:hypothetical protein
MSPSALFTCTCVTMPLHYSGVRVRLGYTSDTFYSPHGGLPRQRRCSAGPRPGGWTTRSERKRKKKRLSVATLACLIDYRLVKPKGPKRCLELLPADDTTFTRTVPDDHDPPPRYWCDDWWVWWWYHFIFSSESPRPSGISIDFVSSEPRTKNVFFFIAVAQWCAVAERKLGARPREMIG